MAGYTEIEGKSRLTPVHFGATSVRPSGIAGLAVLHMVGGFLWLALVLIFFITPGEDSSGGTDGSSGSAISLIGMAVLAAFLAWLILVPVLSLIAGYGLWRMRPWAWWGALVASVLTVVTLSYFTIGWWLALAAYLLVPYGLRKLAALPVWVKLPALFLGIFASLLLTLAIAVNEPVTLVAGTAVIAVGYLWSSPIRSAFAHRSVARWTTPAGRRGIPLGILLFFSMALPPILVVYVLSSIRPGSLAF